MQRQQLRKTLPQRHQSLEHQHGVWHSSAHGIDAQQLRLGIKGCLSPPKTKHQQLKKLQSALNQTLNGNLAQIEAVQN